MCKTDGLFITTKDNIVHHQILHRLKKNNGKMDRIFRFAVAISLSILAYAGIFPADLALPVYIVSVVIALTGVTRVCLLYKPFGITTCREKAPF